MTKKTLSETVAAATGKPKTEAKASVDAVVAGIRELTQNNGDRVIIPGFGTFSRKLRAARQGRNPSTGEAITIAETSVLTFKAAKQ